MSTPKTLSAALDALVNGTLTADQFVAHSAVVKYGTECQRALTEKKQSANPVASIRMAAALERLEARSKGAKSMAEAAADYWNKRNAQKESQ
ncbi:hypothetical protein EJO68_04165 [Variovorax atrisoli]|uniref:hypothetical protein n=1 Tax=Variovorax atrisoli TaxID=3394203 RepID=UPI000F7DD821|nr:hypothetical protein [Variovorax sp. 369]RTD98574.1 hypothetical protein EJO68_04165 [Variovorax sp. 369]